MKPSPIRTCNTGHFATETDFTEEPGDAHIKPITFLQARTRNDSCDTGIDTQEMLSSSRIGINYTDTDASADLKSTSSPQSRLLAPIGAINHSSDIDPRNISSSRLSKEYSFNTDSDTTEADTDGIAQAGENTGSFGFRLFFLTNAAP